jgi:hypothetical protein
MNLPKAVETAWRKLELLSNVTRPLPILQFNYWNTKKYNFISLTDIYIYQYQLQHKLHH